MIINLQLVRRTIPKVILSVALLAVLVYPIHARQFRQIAPIATPDTPAVKLPQGAIPVDVDEQLGREEVEKMLRKVLDQWNSSGMSNTLAEEFYDSSRLNDAMDSIVPRDAKLRLQSVQGLQTVQKYKMPDSSGGRGETVSIVSVTARTQLEFEQPGAGFRRLPGTNEFILKVRTAAPP